MNPHQPMLDWAECAQDQATTVFSLAAAMPAEGIQAVRDELNEALRCGRGYAEFRRRLLRRLGATQAGWKSPAKRRQR